MNKVPIRIFGGDDVHHLIHIKENTITSSEVIIVVMATDEVLDLRKCFLNRIEVWRVRREVFYPDT
jgi:hypothetical protein